MLNICMYSDDDDDDDNINGTTNSMGNGTTNDIGGSKNTSGDNDDDVNGINCQICNENLKQYKCPRCSCLTCSLQCCKQHKVC